MKKYLLVIQVSLFTGVWLGAQDAFAGNADFSDIARNMTNSISGLPGLLTGVSYLIGIFLGIMGILNIKDHVENPDKMPLKNGAVKLAAGGALFALPIIFEAMSNTIGQSSSLVETPPVEPVEFNVDETSSTSSPPQDHNQDHGNVEPSDDLPVSDHAPIFID